MVNASDDVVTLLNVAYVAKEKTTEQKELAGLRESYANLKREVLRLRRQEQGWRNERFLAIEKMQQMERTLHKLERCTFNVAWDTPNKTASYIRDYVSKVRFGLGLDKGANIE